MTTRAMERMAPTEFEIETRGMAIAADLLYAAGFDTAGHLVLVEVNDRIKRKFSDVPAKSAVTVMG